MALVIKKPYSVHSAYYNKNPAVPFGTFKLVYTITKITQSLSSAVEKSKLSIYGGVIDLSMPHRCYLTKQCLRVQHFTSYVYEDSHILGPT